MQMINIKESLGMVIDTEQHGKVKVIGFEEKPAWGTDVIIHLDSYGPNNVIGRFSNSGGLPGGALLVEYV
ncbi:hypothetical protein [Paenibacillus sp. FSL L8-0463]|uniref:hypothetical protein n=1 Tax=Paenibacillus sp. FSL L8-0463 TaxID=2954687 RepID=UPI003119A9A3